MSILCHIKYTIDPFKRDAFERYAENWATVIPQCGGETLGYYMPYEGTNNIAIGLNRFADLAAYETYRHRLERDERGAANYRFAQDERIILAEDRMFLRPANGHQ